MSEYNEIPLKELVRIKGGKRLPKGSSLQVHKSNHPYIRVRDMGQRYIDVTALEFVPDDVFEKISRYIVEEGDLIISIVGTIGLVSIISKELDRASQTENCAKLSGLGSHDRLYLYYFLNSRIGQQRISQGTVGAVQAKLPIYSIESLSIIWPETKIRSGIAYILGTLDDKIELNRQMNRTLENMAQALFKSWFVDFDPVLDNALVAGNEIPEPIKAKAEKRKAVAQDKKLIHTNPELAAQFPNKFQFSETLNKWIPEGWEVKGLGEIANFGNGKSSPERLDDGIYPVFGSNGQIGRANESNREDIIVIGRVGTYCGSLYYFSGKAWITDNAMFAQAKKISNNLFLFELLKRCNLNDMSTGSGQPLLNQGILKSIDTVFPSDEILKNFSSQVIALELKKTANNEQTESLIQLRDILLPKLISGKVRLPEDFVGRFEG